MSRKWVYSLIVVVVFLAVWFAPVPAGLKPQAWHVFAIFLATIVGFMLDPFPMSVIALISLVVAVFTATLSLPQVLTAFSSTLVWLVVSAFIFATGFTKTGLGKRIAYVITRTFGGSSLGLMYSLTASAVVLGPVTPSNTARAGGIMFPIVNSLCQAFDSYPGPSAKRIGAFLMSAMFHVDIVVSCLFMTATACNPLSVGLAKSTLGVEITWGTWLKASIVPALVGLIVVPYVIYLLCPPELKKTPEAQRFAASELEKMGPMSSKEKILTVVFCLALLLWGTSEWNKFDATQVALLGICIMLVTGVVTWTDVIKESRAWDTLVWMGSVVCLAGFLNSTGFIKWFATKVASTIVGHSWIVALLVAFFVYFYSHYAFASATGHVTAMYAAMIAVAAAAGAPVFLTAFAIAVCADLCPCLTHYGTGPGPIYFGAGYIDQGKWWRDGFIMSLVHAVIWLGIGSIWWKVLRLW